MHRLLALANSWERAAPGEAPPKQAFLLQNRQAVAGASAACPLTCHAHWQQLTAAAFTLLLPAGTA